ncbi:alanine racemase [soil metagenome]
MSFTLDVDAARWRAHLASFHDKTPGLVPVIKGNGYGLTHDTLAHEAALLGVSQIAVGTYAEAPAALASFPGDVLVMSPWRPFLTDIVYDPRLVHTLGRVSDFADLRKVAPVGTRVIAEALTSMARHGLNRHAFAAAAAELDGLVLDGLAIHLPMAGANFAEAENLAAALQASRLETTKIYLSHLTDSELALLRGKRPELDIRPRIGTALWLGDRGALSVCASVLDRHQVSRGERIGYRQRPMPRDGTLVIVSGGTAHGIGLEAPSAASGVRQRATSLAKGGLDAAGLALSPFVIGGKQRWFAEPPHMQASMLFLPRSVTPPEIGDVITAGVRFTTTYFDAITLT